MTGWVIPWAARGKLSLLLHRTFLNWDFCSLGAWARPLHLVVKVCHYERYLPGKKRACSFFTYLLFVFLTLSSVFPFCLAAMWLRAARRRHLAVCVSGQLRHLLALIPLAVSSQHGHRHRRHRHGNRLPRLLGCHQGEQVPASECELIFKYICHSCHNRTV